MKNKINRDKLLAKSGKWLVAIARTVLIIGMSYVFLFPVLYLVSTSIRDAATVSDPSIVWVPKQLSLESIQKAWDVLNYSESAVLSLVIAVVSTLFTCISCSLVGYGLARYKFKERNVLFFVVILMIIVPTYVVSIPNYMQFRFFDIGIVRNLTQILHIFFEDFKSLIHWNTEFQIPVVGGILHILNAITGGLVPECINITEQGALTFILPSIVATGMRAGLFIFIFRQSFLGLPKDLEEAACIDGCSPMKTYIRVIVPLATSAFITVLLFSFVWHWNEYNDAAIYFLGDLKPVSVMLANLRNNLQLSNPEFIVLSSDLTRTYLAAGALLVVLPPLVLYIFTQKYFTESIERTGIVG